MRVESIKLPMGYFLFLLAAIQMSAYAVNGDLLWPPEEPIPWLRQGVPVVQALGDQKNFDLCSDGAGGVFVVWQSDADSDGIWNIYVQRLNASGNQVWTSPVLLSNPAQNAQKPAITTSGAERAIAAWVSGSPAKVYAQRINSDGSLSWPAAVQLSSSCYAAHGVDITEGYSQGAFVVFTSVNVRVVHINFGGTLTNPGIDGIDLGAAAVDPPVIDSISTNTVYAYAAFSKSTAGNEDIAAQRISRNREWTPSGWNYYLDLPWGNTPIIISSDTRDERSPSLAVDADDNALIAWHGIDSAAVLSTQVRVQKINAGGLCQWGADGGIVILNSSTAGGTPSVWRTYGITLDVISDSAGGAIAAWSDWRNDSTGSGNDDIYAQRIYSSGTVAWPLNGVVVRSAAGSQRYPQMAPDGSGGCVVTWQDHAAFGPDIHAARLTGSGTIQWSKVVFQDGQPGDSGQDQRQPQIVLDLVSNPCPTGSILVWLDTRSADGKYDLYAQKIQTSLTFPSGDFNFTGCQDLADLIIFCSAWLSSSGQPGWNAGCDLAAALGVIDLRDFKAFAAGWLQCDCP